MTEGPKELPAAVCCSIHGSADTPDAGGGGRTAPGILSGRTRGCPTKRTPETARRLCDAIARGMPLKHACGVADIAYSTFCEWRNADEGFCEQIEQAIAEGVERRLKLIEQAANLGDWRAAAWLLEHCQPEHFAKTRVQVEHSGTVNHEFSIAPETLNEIAAARRRIEQERLLPGA